MKDKKELFSAEEADTYERRGFSLSDLRHYKSVKNYIAECSVNKYLKQRGVWWFCETYLPEDEFQYALSKAEDWAYIYHDKDDKEPHYHVLLHYSNSRSGFAVLKDFIGYQNTFAKEVYKKSSPVICYEYLTHLNDPDKYQYAKECIVCHNPVYWEHFLPSIRDRNEIDFVDDLLNSDDLDLVYMAKKYGRDFIKNYRSYLDFRNEVKPLTQKKYYN